MNFPNPVPLTRTLGNTLKRDTGRVASSHRLAITENGTLTHREKQVLLMIAEDFTNKEIAGRLGITVKTIEFHRAKIKEKLNANGVAGVVRYAIRMGLLKP